MSLLTRSFHRLASPRPAPARSRWRRIGYISGGLCVLGLSARHIRAEDPNADDESTATSAPAPSTQPLSVFLRTYVVYTLCSIPPIVEYAPTILAALESIPGVRQVTHRLVRISFFDQFVGGDSAHETLPLLKTLRSEKKGALFAYSVEVDEHEAGGIEGKAKKSKTDDDILPPHKRSVNEMIRCIDVAADFEDGHNTAPGSRRTWVALKLTALLPDANSLIRLSAHILRSRYAGGGITLLRGEVTPSEGDIAFPGCPTASDLDILSQPTASKVVPLKDIKIPNPGFLTDHDIEALRVLHADLERICLRAQERGVKIIVDAEYSWYQPAIDALTLALMRKFNALNGQNGLPQSKVQPLVYGTYQAYLRRTPEHLALALADSRKHKYALGVKLVRGAYHPHELAAHNSARTIREATSASVQDQYLSTTTPTADNASSTPSSLKHMKRKRAKSLSISPDALPPVWENKSETDTCYNTCVRMLVGAVKADVEKEEKISNRWLERWRGANAASFDRRYAPRIGLLFGTHNWNSCTLILEELVANGLAEGDVTGVVRISKAATERVALGQLYGMCDDLTDWLVQHTNSVSPFVIKYVPYGELSEVMPYLGRRALENKSMLGGGAAQRERDRAWREIWRRVTGSP